MSPFVDSVNAFSQLINIPNKAQDGPLKGYKFAVKDVFDINGYRTQAGNPNYFNQAKVADQTAPAVSILQDAGATLVGKTHTDELGGSLFGINMHYGTPLNVTSPDRVPGGSSSGSAAAVAAGLIDFALGADTSGSVRAPASFCGIYGFRPTHGRIPTTGILPISEHLDTVGIFAEHPNIIAQVLKAYGIQDQSQFTRLRIIPSLVNSLKSSLNLAFLEKLSQLTYLISSRKPLLIEEDRLIQWSTIIRTIAMYDLWQVHKEWILKSNPTFGDLIKDRLNTARSISYEDYKLALNEKIAIRKFMMDNIEQGDIVVFPTVHDIPPLLTSPLSQLKDFALKAGRHTCIAALSGFPEITLPLKGIKNGCSLGMSFLGRESEDYAITLFAAKTHSLINGE